MMLVPTIYSMFFLYGTFVPSPLLGFAIYILVNVSSEYFLNYGTVKNNVWVVEPVTGASRALVFFLCG